MSRNLMQIKTTEHKPTIDKTSCMKKKTLEDIPLCLLLVPLVGDFDLESFKDLIALGADVNESDCNGVTPLWLAAQQGNYEAAKILIEHGANLESRDRFGNSPLLRAVFHYKQAKDDRLIKLLLDAGADIHCQNNSGITPLKLANTIAGFPYLYLFKDKK